MSRLHPAGRRLRPLLPLAALAAVLLVGAWTAQASAPIDEFDAAQLVQRYDAWFAGVDGGAALAACPCAVAPGPQGGPAPAPTATAAAGPTIEACRSSSRSTRRTPSPGC